MRLSSRLPYASNGEDLLCNIEKGIQYALGLTNVKYELWRKDTDMTKAPTYAAEGTPPSIQEIRERGINCAGLINLVRRELKLPIPGGEYPGGTYAWCEYLRSKLHKFDTRFDFPRGTLLLRKYEDEDDQGHLAIVITGKHEEKLKENIIHAIPEGGVTTENTIGQSHFYFAQGYYQYYCLPEDWLAR